MKYLQLPTFLTATAASLLVACTASFANTPLYRVTLIDDPKGTHFLEARAINNKGQVVGVSVSQVKPGTPPEWHGFILRDGKYNGLPPLTGDKYSEAVAINDAGQIVGSSSKGAGGTKAVVWKNGVARALPSPGPSSSASAINNKGVAVGCYSVPGNSQAVLWNLRGRATMEALKGYSRALDISDSGDIVTLEGVQSYVVNGAGSLRLGTLGGTDTMATALNSEGAIVGFSDTKTDLTHAFLWQRGAIADVSTMRSIDGTAAVLSADGINDAGTIVGTVRDGFDTRAMVFSNGHASNLNHLIPSSPLVLDIARAVNNRGQIVGQGHIGNHFVSFLLTPIKPVNAQLAPVSALTVTPSGLKPAGPAPGTVVHGGPVDTGA